MPNDRRQAEIGKNGYVALGTMGNFLYMHMQAPDGMPLARLEEDSKLFMDLMLRGLYFSRSFGSEQVRITSLGPAKEHAVHIDAYKREWQVRRWFI